jgi:hypothetical protein
VYLASPQKFDEAIEFGFPSHTEAHNPSFFKSRPTEPTVRKVQPEPGDHDCKIAEGDEYTQFIEDATMNPETKVLAEETEEFSRTRSSSSSNCTKPFPVLDHYPHTSPGNREMTLRMTLTRKDLRACEDLCASREWPPAPESIPPENEQCTIDWEALDRECQSGLKKLWRKVKRH